MAYGTASTSELESVIEDENDDVWFLKDALGTTHVGVTIMELDPGTDGFPHDESESGQEEVYLCVRGEATVEVEGDVVTLGEQEAIRVDPEDHRQVRNEGDERLELVVVGAPLDGD